MGPASASPLKSARFWTLASGLTGAAATGAGFSLWFPRHRTPIQTRHACLLGPTNLDELLFPIVNECSHQIQEFNSAFDEELLTRYCLWIRNSH